MVAETNRSKSLELTLPARPRVAVCVDTRDTPGRGRVLGIYDFAVRHNWDLLLVRPDEESADERVIEMKAHGAILYDRPRQVHETLRRLGVFCVETSARNLDLDDAAVFADDRAIAESAAHHLLGLKLEHFAYCGLLSRWEPSSRREQGYSSLLARHGFKPFTFHYDGGDSETSLATLARWLHELPKPCGLFAFDDRVAERITAICRWAGMAIPEAIALVGVGDDELICELTVPRLSSIRIPAQKIGRRAAEILAAHLEGRPFPLRQELPPTEIVVRASSERQFRSDPEIARAIEFLKARASRPFGTDQLAEAAGIPRRTLERRFLASTGKTIHEYLIDYRLHLAKQMLRRSSVPLNEVARQCGYSAPSAFTRIFVDRENQHPGDYRRGCGIPG